MKYFIFVYGSLRRGSDSEMTRTFRGAALVSPATVKGALYDLGDYPGLVLDSAGQTIVGEIYEVDERPLVALDQFELSSDYHRTPVIAQAGVDQRPCWVYLPPSEACAGKSLISSGDWIEFAGGRKK